MLDAGDGERPRGGLLELHHPYPPGFPILVPGQVISREIIDFMRALDVKEIHGYRPELGLRVFTEAALTRNSWSRIRLKAAAAE